jgi:CHAT domain-containing protein
VSSRALGQLLLGNVAIEADAVIRHIYIMPDGPLWLLPFDLLTFSHLSGDAEEPLLADIAPITLGPSMAVLSHLSKGPEILHPDEWKLALIGHPELPQDATPIDGTGVQIRSIRDMAPSPTQVTVLAEGKAVKAQAMDEMSWATHIHLATHAEQRDDSPRLILTDGVLTVADILGRSMQAELVFLSVCAGAYGSQSTGEGVISLARSFMFAGCRCVVAPSWPVPDAETATFVLDFYRRLFDGKPIAVAVFETRNEMRRRGMSIRTWGAFQALGNAERWLDRTSLAGIRFGDQA